jgi:hypothetical protein
MKHLLVYLLLFVTIQTNSQILNLPLMPEIECEDWCWAISAKHVITYYGYEDVTNCKIADYIRQTDTINFGSINCCEQGNSCCKSLKYLSNIGNILSHWGIPNEILYRPLTLQEIIAEISNKRPFLIRYPGHVDVGYGIDGYDIYIRDPGWGFDIRDYRILKNGTTSNNMWTQTIRMQNSPISCMQNIIHVNGVQFQDSVYKALEKIYVSCEISNNSYIIIKAIDEIIIEPNFMIGLGSSLLIEVEENINVHCP